MLSQVFNRSTAIRRNFFGYFPTRLFATCSSFPCKVCLIRVSQVKGSVHSLSIAAHDLAPRFLCLARTWGSIQHDAQLFSPWLKTRYLVAIHSARLEGHQLFLTWLA